MNPVYFLAIDFRAGTVTRYEHKRGHWGAVRRERAVMDPVDMDHIASIYHELARFRMTGKAE